MGYNVGDQVSAQSTPPFTQPQTNSNFSYQKPTQELAAAHMNTEFCVSGELLSITPPQFTYYSQTRCH